MLKEEFAVNFATIVIEDDELDSTIDININNSTPRENQKGLLGYKLHY